MNEAGYVVNTVNFRFAPGDKVHIKGTDTVCVVCMSCFDGSIQYQCLLDGGVLLILPDALIEEYK